MNDDQPTTPNDVIAELENELREMKAARERAIAEFERLDRADDNTRRKIREASATRPPPTDPMGRYIAAADAATRAALDPETDYATMRKAALKAERAAREAEAHTAEIARLEGMVRSLDRQAVEIIERQTAEAKAETERQRIAERETDRVWLRKSDYIRKWGTG